MEHAENAEMTGKDTLNRITERIISAAIQVDPALGRGALYGLILFEQPWEAETIDPFSVLTMGSTSHTIPSQPH